MKNESKTREMNDKRSGKSHISVPFFCFISDELTRLWNLNHDNMDACKSESRSDKVHLKFDSHFLHFYLFYLVCRFSAQGIYSFPRRLLLRGHRAGRPC